MISNTTHKLQQNHNSIASTLEKMTTKATQTLLTLFGSFCLLGSIGNQHGLLLVAGQDFYCESSPNVMTNTFGKDIPQTCVNVPYDSGDNSTTTIKRCFYTYVPEKCKNTADAANTNSTETDPLKANLPLVFDIHGVTSCPYYSATYTGWMEKAEEECFVVVWPIGNSNDNFEDKPCWNLPGFLRDNDYGAIEGTDIPMGTSPCCCFEDSDEAAIPSKEPNDPLFLRIAIDAVVKSFDDKSNDNVSANAENNNTNSSNISIDRSRVYMAGHSNGCMTSLAMAALYSDVVAAVCCHAGTLITPFPSDYSPVPIWMAVGMLDDVIPIEGVPIMDFGPSDVVGFWSIYDVRNYIASRNNCEELDETKSFGENENVISYKHTNCTNNANVEFVTLSESAHQPYIPIPNSPLATYAETTVDTTTLAWNFCSSYSNPRAQESIAASQDQVSIAELVTDPLGSSASRSRSMHKSGTISGTIVLGIGIGIVLTSSFV